METITKKEYFIFAIRLNCPLKYASDLEIYKRIDEVKAFFTQGT